MSITTTVTIAQALASNASNLQVADTAGNIAAALPNPALLSRVQSFTLISSATLAAAAAEKLGLLGAKLQLNGAHITIRDTLAAIDSAANAAGVAVASVRQVADAAYNLLNAPGGSFTHVTSVVLLGAPTLNVAQYIRLQGLPAFSVDPSAHITLADTLTAVGALMAAHPAWLLPITALSLKLDGSHIGAFEAAQIAALEGHGTSVSFQASGANTTLPVQASAHDLAANAMALNHLAGQVGIVYTLTDEGDQISAADAAALAGLAGFNPAAHTLIVADTGAAISARASAIFGHGYTSIVATSGVVAASATILLNSTLHLNGGASAMLSASATVTAAQAVSLLALQGFALATGTVLTAADTLTNVLAHAGALAGVSAVQITDSETITAAQAVVATVLANEFGANFSLAGHTISVSDTAANLLALPAPVLALVTNETISQSATLDAADTTTLAARGGVAVADGAVLTVLDTAAALLALDAPARAMATNAELSASAVVNALQFLVLRDALHAVADSHSLTVTDTAANLLTITGALGLAAAYTLSANATVSAAQATTLAGDPGFSLGGHVLTITDTAANILALSPAVQALAASLVLSGAQTVSAAQLTALAALGASFAEGGHSVTVADSAAALAALSAPALALAGAETLTAPAVVSVATASMLASLANFTPGAGNTITIQDSAAHLLALPAPVLALATAFQLAADATVSAAQFLELRDSLQIGLNGHVLTVADTAANLLALAGEDLSLAGACVLTADASVSAAQAHALAAEPGFSTGGHALVVSGTAASLLALQPALLAQATSLVLSAAQSVSAAQLVALAAFGPVFTASGHAITVADTAAALAALPAGAVDLASAEVMTQSAVVNAATAASLAALPGLVFAAGATLIVQDSAVSLLGLSPAALALASAVQLSGNATVSVAQFMALRDTVGVALNDHALTVSDTAAALLAVTGALTLAASFVLNADASVSAAQAAALAAEPGFSTGGHFLTVNGTVAALLALPAPVLTAAGALVLIDNETISAAQLAALAGLGATFSTASHIITVSDTAAHLLALPGGALALANACDLSANATVSAAGAVTLAGEPGFSTAGHVLTIIDTAANLLALSPSVQALAGSLVLAAAQSVSAAQLTALAAFGGSFSTGGHALTVAGSAADLLGLGAPALALAAGEMLTQSAVLSGAMAASLVGLANFSLAAGVTVSVDDTAAALLALAPAVLAVATAYTLTANATVSTTDFVTLRDTLHVATGGFTITIDGTAAQLLALSGSNLSLATACVLTGNATLNYDAASALVAEPGFSLGGHVLIVADSAANILMVSNTVLALATVLELNGNQLVGPGMLENLASLGSQFALNGHTIAVQGSAAELLALSAPALTLTNSQIVDQAAVLSSATAQALVALGHVSIGSGGALVVDDTAANLLTLPAGVTALATGYELSADSTVNAAAFATLRTSLGVTLNGHALTIADNAANLLALSGSDLSLASACVLTANATVSVAAAMTLAAEPGFSPGTHVLTISDGAAAVSANLAQLQADFGGLGAHVAITLTGVSPSIAVTAAVYTADSAILDAITNAGVISVSDTAANIAAVATALVADSHLTQVGVVDTAVDVVENLSSLLAIGSKLAVTLSDVTPLAASLVPFLAQLGTLTVNVGVSDTASQIAAVVEGANAAGSTAAITYLETNGVTVSAVSEVSIADLAALEQLGNSLQLGGHAIYVYDTVSHLTATGASAALANAVGSGLISGVYIRTTGGAVTVNAATALTLFNVEGASNNYPPPQIGSIAVTVADSASNIESQKIALGALAGASTVAHIVINANATVSDAVLSDLQTLSATLANGVAVSVADTGATIAQHALSQGSGQSFTPSAWVLSGNGTVTEAQAAVLGALAHFSTAGHTLTLSINADTVISVADANALATIASALNLNGHALLVAGSAAQLSTLSAGALALVTPELTDTLTNILALGAASPLLGGTVTVSDAETLTAAQAQSFLSLIATGGGSGIHVNALGFGGHSETVTGTVAQLQALTASAAWSNSVAVHGAFLLTAQDSVANLTNNANTSFLAGLHATTLAADAVTSAASAEALAGLAAQINFSLGAHTLTVTDSAANLVALQNAAGVALASTLMLSGPATLGAADAETLLGETHLVLNTPLTIADSAENLLDGVLAGVITGSGDAAHIAVQLAAPETLDAETAASPVALPGFDDTQNLTISDTSAYLLASANLAAEQLAVSVTLAGDEVVSANTVLRLSEVPHFTAGDSQLILAGNDFADAATLKAIADFGTNFTNDGHTITATADVLDLTPSEYTNLQSDGVLANGHLISAVLVNDGVSDMNNVLSLAATGVAGATVKIYDSTGSLVSSTLETQAGFTVTTPDGGLGHAFSITETVNGAESAPLVVLEASVLETAITAASAQFASSGAIEVDSGKYLNLYESTNIPGNLAAPALIYNAVTHTISLDIPNVSMITLITLGASTHPSALDISDILVKHHG